MRIARFFSRWLNRWQPSEAVLLVGTSMLVGLTGGAGVWLFKRLIDLAHQAFFNLLGTSLSGLMVRVVVYAIIGEGQPTTWLESWKLPRRWGRSLYERIPAKGSTIKR